MGELRLVAEALGADRIEVAALLACVLEARRLRQGQVHVRVVGVEDVVWTVDPELADSLQALRAAVNVRPTRAAGPQSSCVVAPMGHDALHGPEAVRVGVGVAVLDVTSDAALIRATYARHLLALARAFSSAPSRRPFDWSPVDEGERNELLELGRGPAVEPFARAPAAIFEWSERDPERLAAMDAGSEWTYRRLVERAAAWATAIRARVAEPRRVGIGLERSVDALAATLGAWWAGASFVPLDPAYPAERRAFMLAQAGADLEIAAAPTSGVRDIPLLRPEEVGAPGTALAPRDGAEAYVFFTSGSTGRPKGASVRHDQLSLRFAGLARSFAFTTPPRVVAGVSFSFDPSLFELVFPLVLGGTIFVLDEEERRDPARFVARIDAFSPTMQHLPPPQLRMLVEQGWRPTRTLQVVSGGEAMSPSLAARLAAEAGALWNEYGPTETVVCCARHRVDPHAGVGVRVPIGRPLAGDRLAVMANDGGLAGLGEPGELWIAGAMVSDGYVGDGDENAARFVTTEVFGEPQRAFRTGDVVAWNELGELEFLGREDGQVKIRGVRVELGEVEAAVEAELGAPVAAVRHGDGLEAALVAYVGTERPLPRDALARLRHRLPPAMQPARLVRIPALPTTPTGKVDRRALAMLPLPASADEAPTAEPPRDEHERRVAEAVASVLGLPKVARSADWDDLGMDSVRRARLRGLLEGAGVPTTYAEIARHANVAALAEVTRGREVIPGPGASPRGSHPLVPGALDVLRCTDAQTFLYLSSLGSTGTGLWAMQVAFVARGDFDPQRFERAWNAVVARHEALRSTFVVDEEAGSLLQCVHPTAQLEAHWPVVEPGTPHGAAVAELQADELRRPFDFTRAPLLRVAYARAEDGSVDVVVTYHPLALDGWSANLALDEAFSLYDADARGAAPMLAAPAPMRRHVDRLASFDVERGAAFFRATLDGFAARPLPGHVVSGPPPFADDLPGPATTLSERTGIPALRLSPSPHALGTVPRALTDAVRARASALRVGLGTLLQSAWGLTLLRYIRSRDVVFSIAVANRGGFDGVLGQFVNLVPVRVTLHPGTSAAAFVKEQERYLQEAVEHEATPASAWGAEQLGAQLTFTVLNFAEQTFATRVLADGGVASGWRNIDRGLDAGLGLAVTLGAELGLRLVFGEGVLATDDAARVVADYLFVLGELVALDDDAPLEAVVAGVGARGIGVGAG